MRPDLVPEHCYSPAALAKAYFSAMGIKPPQEKFNIPDRINGIALQSLAADVRNPTSCGRPYPSPISISTHNSPRPLDKVALDNGSASLVIATEPHRAHLLQKLRADSVDVDSVVARGLLDFSHFWMQTRSRHS